MLYRVVSSVVEIFSFITSIVALFVAFLAYKLQLKADRDLKRIEDNMNRMEANTQQIDKILFEVEKVTLLHVCLKRIKKLYTLFSMRRNMILWR